LRKGDKRAKVEIPEDQLSLAIGRHGQNVRLASRLTGWELDIVESGTVKETPEAQEEEAPTPQKEAEETKSKPKTRKKKDTTKSPARTNKAAAKPKVKKAATKKSPAQKGKKTGA